MLTIGVKLDDISTGKTHQEKSEGVKRAFCFMSRTVINGISYTKHGDHLTSLTTQKDRGKLLA